MLCSHCDRDCDRSGNLIWLGFLAIYPSVARVVIHCEQDRLIDPRIDVLTEAASLQIDFLWHLSKRQPAKQA